MKVILVSRPPLVFSIENPGEGCITIKDTHVELLECASDRFVKQYISNLRYNSQPSRGGKELWLSEDPRHSRDVEEGQRFLHLLLKKLGWEGASDVMTGPVPDYCDWLYDSWTSAMPYIRFIEDIKSHIDIYERRGEEAPGFASFAYYNLAVGEDSWENTPDQRYIPWQFYDEVGNWYSTGREKVRWPASCPMAFV